jgi:hypothetical protein
MALLVSKTLSSGYNATYARIVSTPSIRFDGPTAELRIGIYKDAPARFADAQPADYEMQVVQLTEDERSAILATLYSALDRLGTYPDATKRDPDPEKITEAK